METRVYCKKLKESILSRASWEVLAGGCLITVTCIVLPQVHSDDGKGFLPVEEEVQGGQEKPSANLFLIINYLLLLLENFEIHRKLRNPL